MKRPLTWQEALKPETLLEEMKLLATPINFAALERSGVISKAGAWYRLHKPLRELPAHVSRKIREMKPSPQGPLVKFDNKTAGAERLLKKHEATLTKKIRQASL